MTDLYPLVIISIISAGIVCYGVWLKWQHELRFWWREREIRRCKHFWSYWPVRDKSTCIKCQEQRSRRQWGK